MYSLIKIVLFSVLSGAYCTLTTQYYKDLINQKISEAENYQLPQRNEEFQTGADSTKVQDFGSYDFIIVGAGTAGSVLATRLSEIHKWNILLLEAGDKENDFNIITHTSFYLLYSENNWGYMSTRQANTCLGMKDQKCFVPRGKSIGGTSAINGVFNVRGNAKDYDNLVESGNPGWSYKDVLRYFIKAENSQIDGDLDYHGTGGFWNLEHASPDSHYFNVLVEASAELNHSYVDYNGRNQIGVSKPQFNIKNGKRQGTGTAFLQSAHKRKNLKIVKKALATKINIDNNVAQGVEFVSNDIKYKATAKKEVLVSAGAVNSPQLLMLSGIGPKEHLEELGINVVVDLPVGKNLSEHPLFLGLNFHTNYEQEDNLESIIEQFLQGSGPLTKSLNIDGTGFIPKNNGLNDVPMTQYMFIIPGGVPVTIAPKIYNFNDKLTNNYLYKLNAKTNIGFFLLLLHQKSRGHVTLKSNNPIDFPNIDLNLFSDPEDIENMIEGIEFIIKLTKTKAFQRLNATLVDIPICEEYEKYSKTFWTCVIRQMSMGSFHLCGSTAMGSDKTTSVVDHNLKVHGIEKLRVVDAGIFPTTISGPTYAPTVMVAEKISDVIKQDYDAEEHNRSFFTDQTKDNCYQN